MKGVLLLKRRLGCRQKAKRGVGEARCEQIAGRDASFRARGWGAWVLSRACVSAGDVGWELFGDAHAVRGWLHKRMAQLVGSGGA